LVRSTTNYSVKQKGDHEQHLAKPRE